MRTIYIDADFKCHLINDGTMKAIETEFFDRKCDAYIEGYCYDDRKGYVQIYPWKDFNELNNIQKKYERQLLEELQNNSIPIIDLDTSYQNGINSI